MQGRKIRKRTGRDRGDSWVLAGQGVEEAKVVPEVAFVQVARKGGVVFPSEVGEAPLDTDFSCVKFVLAWAKNRASLLYLREGEDVSGPDSRADLHFRSSLLILFPNGNDGREADGLLAFLDAVPTLIPGPHREDVDVGMTVAGPRGKPLADSFENFLRVLNTVGALLRDTEVNGSHSGVGEWEVHQDRAERSAADTVDFAATSRGRFAV
jgi:hypothetical protein